MKTKKAPSNTRIFAIYYSGIFLFSVTSYVIIVNLPEETRYFIIETIFNLGKLDWNELGGGILEIVFLCIINFALFVIFSIIAFLILQIVTKKIFDEKMLIKTVISNLIFIVFMLPMPFMIIWISAIITILKGK